MAILICYLFSELPRSQQDALWNHRDQLQSSIELNSVLRGLLKAGIFTKTLNFEVMKKPAGDRVDRLLGILCTRGSRAFWTFCRLLLQEGEIELGYTLQKVGYSKEIEVFW